MRSLTISRLVLLMQQGDLLWRSLHRNRIYHSRWTDIAAQHFSAARSTKKGKVVRFDSMHTRLQSKEPWKIDLMIRVLIKVGDDEHREIHSKRLTGADWQIELPLLHQEYSLQVYPVPESQFSEEAKYVFVDTGQWDRILDRRPQGELSMPKPARLIWSYRSDCSRKAAA